MLLPQKLSLYLCVCVITICPRKSRIEAAGSEKEPTNKDVDETRETSVNYGSLDISDPGFHFTDEEIRNFKFWPRGIIPYFIDDFSFDKVLRDRLRSFLEHTNSVAGVRFSELALPPPDDNSRWVFFINRRGLLSCADVDIRQFNSTGVQKVVIGYDCMEPGNLAEIALALVGVPPQHNAPNRDEYVEVQEDNILPDKKHLFKKFSDSEWLFHEFEYDFTSAGHYGYHKYTSNGGATLTPLIMVDIQVGEVIAYSSNDIWKMRMLYNHIRKKDNKSLDNGTCSKLFKPSSKFKDFIPNEEDDDELKPRPKPYNKTGIDDQKLSHPDSDNYDSSNNGKNKVSDGDDSEDQNKPNQEHNKEKIRYTEKTSSDESKKIDKSMLKVSDTSDE